MNLSKDIHIPLSPAPQMPSSSRTRLSACGGRIQWNKRYGTFGFPRTRE